MRGFGKILHEGSALFPVQQRCLLEQTDPLLHLPVLPSERKTNGLSPHELLAILPQLVSQGRFLFFCL